MERWMDGVVIGKIAIALANRNAIEALSPGLRLAAP
jgi:hypothetical protein